MNDQVKSLETVVSTMDSAIERLTALKASLNNAEKRCEIIRNTFAYADSLTARDYQERKEAHSNLVAIKQQLVQLEETA